MMRLFVLSFRRFTTEHIAGGTLDAIDENPGDRRVFKLKWLLQLTRLVDDLNYKYGMQHQAIAPRNLLVDEATENIMLFDFNFSARIGAPLRSMGTRFFKERDDIKGVIFTLVLNIEDWVQYPYRNPHGDWHIEHAEEMVGTSERNEDLGENNMDAAGGDESEDQTPGYSENEGADSVLTPEICPTWAINGREARDNSP
ncbi:hypothetical protein LA080_002735 [Diaporthe eres]|nr:hypothetical protein LA080_002735 [Diaporthe eres]